MHTFKATEISFGQGRVVRAAEGKWVDVGKEHLSLAVLLPELEEDVDDPPPDTLDIFFSMAPCEQLAHVTCVPLLPVNLICHQ